MTRRTGLFAAAAALLQGCSATRALDALVPSDTYRGRMDIAYGSVARQRLDAYLPLRSDAPVPLAVFFYGGSWTRGERAGYRFVGEALAARGIATLVADYRLSPQVGWREILQDCAQATRWAFDNAQSLGADARRIHVFGHSAGAYNAAMLALDARWLGAQGLSPRALAGWVGIAGPYDFLPIRDPETQVAFGWPGTPPDSQPLVHASAEAPRTLLLAAQNDTVVSPQRSTVALARRLEALGVPVRMRLLERLNHATALGVLATPLQWMAPVHGEVVGFLSAQPGAAPPADPAR
ncbi:MAG: alpha/beta hydrolase [Ramlibacter sp.]|nr:alpha/beta hydrolase [Ramlibacter sp.]